jgi:hypothetical protein
MARIDNIINVNSVWNSTTILPVLESVTLNVWIYSGTQGDDAAINVELGASNSRLEDPTYVLKGSSILNGSDKVVQFDIAPLVRDYVESELNQSHNSNNSVWVDIQSISTINGGELINASEHFLALDGYEYTMNIVGNQVDDILRISNTQILNSEGSQVSIPILTKDVSSYIFSNNGVDIGTSTSVTSTSNLSNEQVLYIESLVDTQVDKLSITTTQGEQIVVSIQNECITRYEHSKITFVNRFGSFQDVWFFANNKRSINVKSDSWNRRNKVVGGGAYRPTTIRNIKSVNERHTLNSGFYPESNNVVFEELIQAENVWITKGIETFPIIIKNSSFNFKDSNTNKAINYTIDFEYAFNKMRSL